MLEIIEIISRMEKTPKKHGGKRPGAGRKSTAHPEGPTVKIGASVPESLVAELQELCDERGWNLSQGVTEAIRRLTKNRRTKR